MLKLLAAIFLCCVSSYAFPSSTCEENTIFNIGAGIYDITGPVAEEGMMGYAMLDQQTKGLLSRLWARAFIIESPCNHQRIVFVNTDLGMVFQAVKQQVVQNLQKKWGDRYNEQNILITATHEHSGPGGFSTYALYNLSTLGFNRQNFDVIVLGIVKAIEHAQNNMSPAQIKINQGELSGISFNRSKAAYLQNPPTERQRYLADTDTEMTLIRFDDLAGRPLGLINWFPIHGVSMNNKNHLVNGDNKGYAEYLFENDFLQDNAPPLVAAFAQANAGDVTPNPNGHEGGKDSEGLLAVSGAGFPQYKKAKELFVNASVLIKGGVDYRHTFVAMDKITVDPAYTDGKERTTCPAAIGISMLAGTTDGEGVGRQGITCLDVKKRIPHFICKQVTTACQGVKPLALQTGLMKPHPWTPNILPLQIFKIGQLVIVAVPFEVTTMMGRRIKEAVAKEFPTDTYVVLSTLANAYAGYVATNQEYQIQRYEGASTHFGPWTGAALQQEYVKLAKALLKSEPVTSSLEPPDLLGEQITLQRDVIFDDKPLRKNFGDLYQDVKSSYKRGETVSAIFWGGHPKNNFRTEDSFLAVQRLENGQWQTIKQDKDWDTEYHWQRKGLAYSLITIVWRIPSDTMSGQYRLVHYGDWKSGWNGKIYPYTGYSSLFNVE